MNNHFLLTLMKTPKIGRKTVKKIIETMKFSPACLEDLHDLIKAIKLNNPRITVPTIEQLKRAQSIAENVIIKSENMGIKIIGYLDAEFPKKLKEITDPPVVIYTKGSTDSLKAHHSIAIIGTRQPTKFGRDMAECFGMLVGERDITVVSGLAIGCDTAAHQGCLNSNGKTVAILANGLDTVYPKQNLFLAEQIIESSGCLLSEYPPGDKILSNYFVERDRLQSGLSDAVIVIETDIKGGTMHTVNFAIQQNKIIACLDHPKTKVTDKSRGNRKLVLEGTAIPIRCERGEDDISDLVNRIIKESHSEDKESLKKEKSNLNSQLKIPFPSED